MSTRRRAVPVLLGLLLAGSCASQLPETRHYTLVPPSPAASRDEALSTLAVEPLDVDSAYDTERMVYRTSPYRLDYYEYHLWSAHPSLHVADYLRSAYARSGWFRAVVAEPQPEAHPVLGGRLLAFEEVDTTRERWVGHVAVELWLRLSPGGRTLWSKSYDRTVPMPVRNPEGLAQALSAALEPIVRDSAPLVARALQAAAAMPDAGSSAAR